MAYYPPEFAERIRLIKHLQEQRFMPLRVIRELLDAQGGDLERLRALADTGDALVARALGPESERTPKEDVLRRFEIPERALERLAEVACCRRTTTATRRPTCGSSTRSRAFARPDGTRPRGSGPATSPA